MAVGGILGEIFPPCDVSPQSCRAFWMECSLQTDESESQVGFECRASEGFGDVCGTTFAEDTDDEVPQRGHDPWADSGPDLRAVFIEGHVSDPMEFVFDTPLSSVECEDAFWGSIGRG